MQSIMKQPMPFALIQHMLIHHKHDKVFTMMSMTTLFHQAFDIVVHKFDVDQQLKVS